MSGLVESRMFLPTKYAGIYDIHDTIRFARQEVAEKLEEDSTKSYKIVIEDRANRTISNKPQQFIVYDQEYMRSHGELVNGEVEDISWIVRAEDEAEFEARVFEEVNKLIKQQQQPVTYN